MRLPRAAHGWPIVGWCSLVLLATSAFVLGAYGTGEEGVRVLVRTTARTSVLLFCGAFGASALHRLRPTRASGWMLANRRYLGVSFAVSHFVHLAAIVALARVSGFRPGLATLVGGGIAYVFIALMTATSFDRTAAWLGPRRWRLLHLTGGYYLWLLFFQSYVPRALASGAYVPVVLLLVVVAGLRAAAAVERRRARAFGRRDAWTASDARR